jgi:hypothetical protein
VKGEPTLSISQRYLYIMGYMEVSKVFCFQLALLINGKTYKFLYSTVHKTQKTTSQGILQMPLEMKSAKWSVLLVDLH